MSGSTDKTPPTVRLDRSLVLRTYQELEQAVKRAGLPTKSILVNPLMTGDVGGLRLRLIFYV